MLRCPFSLVLICALRILSIVKKIKAIEFFKSPEFHPEFMILQIYVTTIS